MIDAWYTRATKELRVNSWGLLFLQGKVWGLVLEVQCLHNIEGNPCGSSEEKRGNNENV